jgi:hypothetical protein
MQIEKVYNTFIMGEKWIPIDEILKEHSRREEEDPYFDGAWGNSSDPAVLFEGPTPVSPAKKATAPRKAAGAKKATPPKRSKGS